MATYAANDPRISFMIRALDCSSHAYKLAGLLCWRYGNKNGDIFPGQDTLAKDLGVAERRVRDFIKYELVPRGLRVTMKRGPRSGKNLSFYTFDGPVIPDSTDLNCDGNSGHRRPKSSNATAPNLGLPVQQFRSPDDNNSGLYRPPNQKGEPKELTIYPPSPLKGEQRSAIAAVDESVFDEEEKFIP